VYLDGRLGLGIDPAVNVTPARKYQRVYSIAVNNGQFEIDAIWRSRYGLPFHLTTIDQLLGRTVDPHQSARLSVARSAAAALLRTGRRTTSTPA
jgi:hypothetical protein